LGRRQHHRRVNALITLARNEFGPVDVFVANTGIVGPPLPGDDEADWHRVIDVNLRAYVDVNVRAYVRAAKALCARLARPRPRILRRCRLGRRTAHEIDATDYSVTKHVAVDFAEWLSITHGDQGLGASACGPRGSTRRC
jgi:NAD(P)-dependent dehydrogenase (short-subunit alcohol dehydrogenase family)